MTTKEIIAKDRWAAEEAFCKGNVDAFNEVFAPDAIFHTPMGEMKGLEEFKKAIPIMRQSFSDVRIEWEEEICEGNSGMQRFTFHMKHTGTSPMFPMPPTGKDTVYKGCAVYHVKEGKIVEFFEYADMLGFMQQLGAIPPMGQK